MQGFLFSPSPCFSTSSPWWQCPRQISDDPLTSCSLSLCLKTAERLQGFCGKDSEIRTRCWEYESVQVDRFFSLEVGGCFDAAFSRTEELLRKHLVILQMRWPCYAIFRFHIFLGNIPINVQSHDHSKH